MTGETDIHGADAAADQGRRKRSGGRAGMKSRGATAIDQMPWRIPVNPDRPTEPLDADGVQRIHKGAM